MRSLPIQGVMQLTSKRALVGLVALMLVVPTAACGAGGNGLVNAKATYTCLTKRREYRPLGWSSYGHKEQLAFQMPPFRLARFRGKLPYYDIRGVSGWDMTVQFSGVPRYDLEFLNLTVFATASGAQATYRQVLARTDPTLISNAKKNYLVERNVLIDWAVPDGPPKQVRSIILGCLRTR